MSKFRLNIQFSSLDAVRQKMGAPLIVWKSVVEAPTELEIPTVDIEYGSVQEIVENVGSLENGVLFDKNTKQIIFLYIKDNRLPKRELEQNPKGGRKVHLTWCSVLDKMDAGGRFDRYVGTSRTTGLFEVEYLDWKTRARGETFARLHVCKVCLGKLGLPKTENYVAGYDFDGHVKKYSQYLPQKPKYTSAEMPLNEYPPDWGEISNAYRASQNWRCEQCMVDLTQHKGLLDTHHINGNRFDCSRSNLKALCKLCHSVQPQHGHYVPSPNERQAILLYRAEQGIFLS